MEDEFLTKPIGIEMLSVILKKWLPQEVIRDTKRT